MKKEEIEKLKNTKVQVTVECQKCGKPYETEIFALTEIDRGYWDVQTQIEQWRRRCPECMANDILIV